MVEAAFEGIWADLRQRLRPRTIIKNWSIKGYTGGQFHVDGVDGARVTIIPPNGKPRSISKADFGRVYSNWSAYQAGTIGRVELGKLSRNTTYILSLFHWRQDADQVG